MPIFEIISGRLVHAPETSFQIIGLRERADIQRMLKENIEFLADDLMVLAEEFSGWLDSKRRIDLLCLDKQANLVVVELKRDEDGGHMELQALRYAAMISTMTFDQAVDALASFKNVAAPDKNSAKAEILSFLAWEFETDGFAQSTRIILAAADFSKEITTTALWLRDQNIDIRCIRLKPYRLEDGRLLMDIQSLIPLPEAEDYRVRAENKQKVEKTSQIKRHELRVTFLQSLLDRANGRSKPHIGRTPLESGVLIGSIGRGAFSINYVAGQSQSRVELLIQREDAKQNLAKLTLSQAEIHTKFGAELVWQEKEESRQCRIYHVVDGGYRSPEAEWPSIQDQLIEAMLRLDDALRPYVTMLSKA